MPLDFELDARGFDLDNAYFLAKACDALAAGDAGRLADKLRSDFNLAIAQPFDVVDPEDDSVDFHGFVGSSDDAAFIVFRGVNRLDPWLKDAAMMQKPALGGLVHKGFADALETVWDSFEPLLAEQREGRELWIAGHGLGGALALLTAARLQADSIAAKAVYTFGAPRVGNLDFFTSFAVPAYRLVNNNDLLAHIPAEQFPIGGYQYVAYKHVGTLVYFDRHGNINEGTNSWPVKKELIREQLLRLGRPPTQWFQDHHLSGYITAIERNL